MEGPHAAPVGIIINVVTKTTLYNTFICVHHSQQLLFHHTDPQHTALFFGDMRIAACHTCSAENGNQVSPASPRKHTGQYWLRPKAWKAQSHNWGTTLRLSYGLACVVTKINLTDTALESIRSLIGYPLLALISPTPHVHLPK